MKTKTLRKKLVLTRETIADLHMDKMKSVYGRDSRTKPITCWVNLESEVCCGTECTCNPSSPQIVCVCESRVDK